MGWTIGDKTEISLRMLYQGQVVYNVWQYNTSAGLVGADPAEVGEGWWNHVKSTYRAVATSEHTGLFRSVFVRNLTSSPQQYGEFTVPTGEQAGTRTSSGGSELVPPFVAAGVRLAVGTNATRPGQKRLVGFVEGDNVSGYVNTAAVTAINNLMTVMVAAMVLGAPVALLTLDPIVVRKDASGTVVASQPIVGYVVNPAFTSQVSRKFGRGI